MALNKDVLGLALYNRADAFNDQSFADLEQARLDFWKAMADEVINHIKTAAVVNSNVTVTVTTAGSATNQAGGGTGTGVGIII